MQAIIHRAVTRGLNLIASINLLWHRLPGEIPAHWEARRVKQATRILEANHRPRNDPPFTMVHILHSNGAVARA
jgi:hypothetical protein